jgi:hypothetical protein
MKINNALIVAWIALGAAAVLDAGAQGGRQRLKEDSFDPASFGKIEVEIGKVKKKQVLASHFVHCTFLDARPDTSKVGFARFGNYQRFHRLVMVPNCTDYLAQDYPSFLAPLAEAKDSLVLVLHRFWLSERYYKDNPNVTHSYCHIVADCYKRQNGWLLPLGPVNVFEKEGWIVHNYKPLLRDAMASLLAKADTAFATRQPIGTAVSWEGLQQQIANKFKFPILTAPQAGKGLYLTYNDFVNNRPTPVDFKVDEGKRKDVIVAPTLDTSVTNHVWGYSDGQHHYIRLAKHFHQLVHNGQTFDLAAPRLFKSNGLRPDGTFVTEVIVGTTGLSTNYFSLRPDAGDIFGGLVVSVLSALDSYVRSNELVPLQLDLSTGTLY